MTTNTVHPPPELIAAMAEGKLKRRELVPLLEHVGECADCRGELHLVSGGWRERRRARFIWIGAAAAGAVAAAVAIAVIRPWEARESRSPLATLAALAPRSARIVEPRLTGGFAYAPYSGPMRTGNAAADAERLKLGGEAGVVIERATRDATPGAQHAAGVAYLLVGDASQAAERLRATAVRAPNDAAIWSDLAAAQYAAAAQSSAPSLLPEALASADHALRVNPSEREALFNRALILERLGLAQQARSAWERYLAVDGTSPWAAEARTRLRMLPAVSGDALFRRELPRLESAAVAGDAQTVSQTVQRWPEQSRAWGEAEFLGRWAEAVQHSDAAEASRLLTVARSIGKALQKESGERLLADAVAAIDTAGVAARATLADAHATYRRARMAYSRGLPSAAEPELRRAAALFAKGHSPMERMARYYAANTRVDQNDARAAEGELEALLPQPGGYIAHGALVRWELSLCRNAAGDVEAARNLLSSAASALQSLGERNNLGFVEALLSETLLLEGQRDDAWAARIRSFQALSADGRGDRLLANIASAVGVERRAGHRQAAMALLGVEREAGRDVQNDVLLSSTLTRTAALSAELGDTDGAMRLIGEVRATAARVTDPAFRALLAAHIDFAEGAARLQSDPAAAARSLTSAASAYEQMGQSTFVVDCYLLRARAEEARGDLAAAARTVDEGLGRFERFRLSLSGRAVDEGVLDSGSELAAEAVRLSLTRGETALAFGYADRARLRFTGDADLAPRDLAEAVRSRLGHSGAAVLEITVLPAETIVFRVDGSGVTAARQAVARDALAAMAQHMAGGNRDAASTLYDLLIRPASVESARSLIIVADSPLDMLPFAALYDAAAKRYLVEQLPLALAESAASLQPPVAVKGLDSIVAVGLPTRGAAGTAALAESDDEVGDVVTAYHSGTALRGAQATFAALAGAARNAEVIHLSGHTEDLGSGGPAVLVFAGNGGAERVSWKAIAETPFPKLRVAALAACSTLRAPARDAGVRATSLGGAFLAAGARAAIGTLRPIGDRDARVIFSALHRQLAGGVPAVQALRNAQLQAIANGTPPAAWGSIAVLTREISGVT